MRSGILRVVGRRAGAFGLAGALLLASAHAAAPPAPLTLTLADAADGGLEVRAGGAVVARVPVKAAPLRRAPARLREVSVEGRRVVEVRVAVRGTPHEEVWIGELPTEPRPGQPQPPQSAIWSGLTGARDADEEVGTEIEIAGNRVVEYQTSTHVTRCDGETVRLFPRAWDFDARRFRPVVSALPAPAAQKLVARLQRVH